jgi:hypothetical protein
MLIILCHFSTVIMEKLWRTITHTDLMVGTRILPSKHDMTEKKELNFKARCSTHLTMTVDILCVLGNFWNQKVSLVIGLCKFYFFMGQVKL